ncbi:MAG TPA: hypothetical protein VK066_06175 [Chloroflexota bacterium]|nr:hypothetical protein [Chloroflexota bacterium]
MEPEDRGLTSQVGPVEVHWVRSVGYFGGIGLAVAFELIEPPLALFIAAVPFLKMLNRPRAPLPVRFVSQLVDGAAKPVGGDSEGTIRLTTPGLPSARGATRRVQHAAERAASSTRAASAAPSERPRRGASGRSAPSSRSASSSKRTPARATEPAAAHS